MSQTQKDPLSAQADKILAKAGYSADGRPKSDARGSVKAISTPCGGKPGWKR